MKKFIITSLVMIMGIAHMFAMSHSTIRENARFLSDRMAYELDLSPRQYDDIYEINYDFLYAINRIMGDVVFGYRDAINQYYDLLDYRNEDIHYVLTMRQYSKFITHEYFYRPVYSTGRDWRLRIHTIYPNHTFFYFDAPSIYKTYRGAHAHHVYGTGYYSGRYEAQRHDRYTLSYKFREQEKHHDMGRQDFGGRRLERNNDKQNQVNNYKNRDQQNRTNDSRYRDNSGNKQSPQINNRQQNSGSSSSRTGSASSSRGNSSNSSSSTRNNSNSSNSSTRVQSGRR